MTRQCTYCGRENPETVDHIPPACLFPSPRPSNLITVPGCTRCNGGASKDDEYFKMWLVMRHDVASKPPGSQLLDSVHRGFARPNGRGLLKTLLRGLRRVSVYSHGGLYLGEGATYGVDLRRLTRVTDRIVKALFLKHFGTPLPKTYHVESFAESGYHPPDETNLDEVRKRIAALLATERRAIGDGVFEYWFQPAKDRPTATIWLLRFFSAETFVCFTMPTVTDNK